MNYTVEYNTHLGRYEMVVFTQLEGNVRLKTDFIALTSTEYSAAVAEAERLELLREAPFVIDLNDLELEEMAAYYCPEELGSEFDS